MESEVISGQGNGKITNPFPRVVEMVETRAATRVEGTEQTIDTPTGAEPLGDTYRSAIRKLINLYSDIENSSYSLPTFSALPLGIFAWSYIKFVFAVLGDLFLFIPINVIIFVRNILPGRWSYKSWSFKYFKYVCLYVWRGDFYPPAIFVRPLTMFLLSSHFRRRLLTIRRRLLLDKTINAQTKQDVLSEIDNALKIWESPTAITMLVSYILPTVGPVMTLWGAFKPSDLPSWAKFIGYLSISYAFAILGSAFVVKRGLMLGGAGRSAYFPGALERPGAYAEEKSIFDIFGIAMRELPIDICVFGIALIISLLFFDMQIEITQAMTNWMNQTMTDWMNPELFSQEQLSSTRSMYMQLGGNIITVMLILVAWRRRITLHRG